MKSWTAGFFLALSLCLDLGIVNVAIFRTALRQGGTAGFLIGVGSGAGDLVYFTLAVFGATALLNWAPFRWTLWLFGTGVLLFLAWRTAREVIHPPKFDPGEAPRPGSEEAPSRLLVKGVALALASPSAILWFAAVGGSVIASMGGERQSLWEFAAGFAIGGVAWSALFAYAAAGLRSSLSSQLVRTLSFFSALLFLYFAAFVFIHGLRQLL